MTLLFRKEQRFIAASLIPVTQDLNLKRCDNEICHLKGLFEANYLLELFAVKDTRPFHLLIWPARPNISFFEKLHHRVMGFPSKSKITWNLIKEIYHITSRRKHWKNFWIRPNDSFSKIHKRMGEAFSVIHLTRCEELIDLIFLEAFYMAILTSSFISFFSLKRINSMSSSCAIHHVHNFKWTFLSLFCSMCQFRSKIFQEFQGKF